MCTKYTPGFIDPFNCSLDKLKNSIAKDISDSISKKQEFVSNCKNCGDALNLEKDKCESCGSFYKEPLIISKDYNHLFTNIGYIVKDPIKMFNLKYIP